MSAQILSKLRRNRRGPIERKLESVQFKPMKVQNHEDVVKDFLVNQFEHFIMESGMAPDDDVNNCNDLGVVPITFKDLPVRRSYLILFPLPHCFDIISSFFILSVRFYLIFHRTWILCHYFAYLKRVASCKLLPAIRFCIRKST